MSNDAAQLVIAGTGTINVAPFGTALPEEVDSALHADFDPLGFITEDGAKFTDSKTIVDIAAWQSFYAVRKIITMREGLIEATLMEWDRRTVGLAFGGGTWTEPSPGSFVYTPPAPEYIDHRSLVVDINDGTNAWRIVIPKGIVVSNTESQFTRTGPALLPITFGVVGQDGVDPWYLATDSDAASVSGQGS